MALTPQNADAFLREVDEEVRKEQLGNFWRRFGKQLIVAVIVALLALGGFLYWKHRQEQAAGKQGEEFTQALRDLGQGKSAPAEAKIKAVSDSGIEGYEGAAKLTLAAAALYKDDAKAAAARYAPIAADADMPQPFRDLALLRQTTAEFDTLPPQQVVDRLKPIAQAGNPWFGGAGELVALAYMKMGKRDLAGPLYAAIAKDKDVPASIRSRAQRMAGVLGIDVAPDPAAGGGK